MGITGLFVGESTGRAACIARSQEDYGLGAIELTSVFILVVQIKWFNFLSTIIPSLLTMDRGIKGDSRHLCHPGLSRLFVAEHDCDDQQPHHLLLC